MNWFENWFNSEYYHILYKKRNEKEAELFIDNIVHYLQLKKSSKIIDIACGKGRHAAHLNLLGFNVVGIDLSTNSISQANQNINHNLKFAVHDMRNTFKKNHFDLAINLFTSFGYFQKQEDEQKAINAMANNLKLEGILIIDFMNVKKVIRNLVEKEVKEIDNIRFDIQRKIENNHILKKITITHKEKKETYHERVKAFTLNNFNKLLKKSGLRIIDIFGNYHLDMFNALSSDRLILVCKK